MRRVSIRPDWRPSWGYLWFYPLVYSVNIDHKVLLILQIRTGLTVVLLNYSINTNNVMGVHRVLIMYGTQYGALCDLINRFASLMNVIN